MAARNYEAPDLRIIGDGLNDFSGDDSQGNEIQAADLSFPVWKDMMGAKNSSYQDYVAWMNQHGYGAFIQDEEY